MYSTQTLKWDLITALLLLAAQFASAQNKTITGTVIENKNVTPVPNVSVVAKGTHYGTQTDLQGHFALTVPDYVKRLSFSAVGFLSMEVDLNNASTVIAKLEKTVSTLNDVLVIGYGTVARKDLTGSIGSLSEKDFNKGNFTSPDQFIEGKVAGVQLINNNGSPGGEFTVRIRGNSALIGTGLPLYVIDGVPLDGRSVQEGNNPLNFINVNDVASISVLKDASATAIYGARAAYGVIIINTKEGQVGNVKLSVATAVGVSSILRKVRVLNAAEYRKALSYYDIAPSFDKGTSSDGLAAILRKAWQQNYNIAGSGGSESAKYRFSLNYLNQDGILINTNFKKYNADVNTSLHFLSNKKMGMDLHLNTGQYIQDGSLLRTGNDGLVSSALNWNPTDSLRNADGSAKITQGDNINPIAYSQNVRDNLKVTTILASLSPYFKLTDWLEYKMLVSADYNSGIERGFINQNMSAYYTWVEFGSATINNYELITNQITNTLNFNKEIATNLKLNAVAGYEYMKFVNKGFGIQANGATGVGFGNYGLDYTNYIQYSNDTTRMVFSYIDPISELQSFFGRATADYKQRYLLTATFRADGSTKFGANNKYGYFPSFAAAWNINNEKFFSSFWINSFKIRGSWGKTGNQEIPAGSAEALYAFQNAGSIAQINNPNPDLKWQADRQYDFGIDLSILNNRVSETFDYFNKKTTDLLFPSPPIQPAPPGAAITWKNLPGKIINKGLEISLNAAMIKNQNIGWDLSVNTTFLKNYVSNMPAPVGVGFIAGPIQTIRNGLPMDAFYTRKFLGLNKDGNSDYVDSGSTFYYVGNPNPNFLLGINSTFHFKNFSLTVSLYGTFGQAIYDQTLMNLNVGGIMGSNIDLSVFQEPVKESFDNPVTPSSRYIEKGSYLKMSNLTLSYRIGDIGPDLKALNLYLTAQNPFIITSYKGFDPEVNIDNYSQAGIRALGIDNSRYPSSRTFLLGINFSI